jgi:3'-phosphoadenosine 5'-phosphosulfate (PAPS) 3'-phosphatase
MDPIDGTQAFAHRGQYAISVALLRDYENTINVIGWPNHSPELTNLPIEGPAIFAAVKGRGAFALDMEGRIFPVRVGEDPRPLIAWNGGEKRVAMIQEQKERLGLTGEIRAMSMVKAIIVATGGARVYCKAFCQREYVWDVAPVELFVREAGGIVTNIDGLPLYFAADGKVDNSERGCLFTSNGPLWHRRAREVIRPYLDKKK